MPEDSWRQLRVGMTVSLLLADPTKGVSFPQKASVGCGIWTRLCPPSFFERRFHVVQNDCELLILLPPLPKSWDYRHELPCPAELLLLATPTHSPQWNQGLMYIRQVLFSPTPIYHPKITQNNLICLNETKTFFTGTKRLDLCYSYLEDIQYYITNSVLAVTDFQIN